MADVATLPPSKSRSHVLHHLQLYIVQKLVEKIKSEDFDLNRIYNIF